MYTSQLPTYADPILDRLDPSRYIAYRHVLSAPSADSATKLFAVAVSENQRVMLGGLSVCAEGCLEQPCAEAAGLQYHVYKQFTFVRLLQAAKSTILPLQFLS